jgi:hypothetical protein
VLILADSLALRQHSRYRPESRFFCLVAFNMFYGIPNIWVYFIAPYLIWVLWMALGLAVLAEVVTRLVRG